MAVAVPFSRAFMLLLLALPGVWLLGRAAAHGLSRDRAVRPVLAVGLALVAWILAVHIASLSLFSMRRGLPVGTLVAAALGIGAEVWRRRRPDRGEGRGPSAWMILSAILATLAMSRLALHFHFHDELGLNGHMPIAGELQNGVYPPRHLIFPDTPLRYHYGFDLLTASLTALFHLRIDQAIDTGTIGLFFLAWCLFWALGERLAGRRAAWLFPLCVLTAGGVPAICDRDPGAFVDRIVQVCWVGKHYVNPPIPSYFFQHPWSIGLPMGATALLVLTSSRPRSPWLRLGVLFVCLAALSFCQITLFAGCGAAFIVAEMFGEDGVDPGRGLKMLAVVALAFVTAKALGGFLVTAPNLPALKFEMQQGMGETREEVVRWNLQTFGLLLPLGLAGLFAMRRDAFVFGLLAAGGILVPNALFYPNSEDIVKFATLANVALGVLSAGALARLWPGEPTASRPSPWRRFAVIVAALGIGFSGLVFVAFVGGEWPGMMAFMKGEPQQPEERDARAIEWVRARIRKGELVYRNHDHTNAYGQWGGLPQPWIQWTVKAFGFAEERIAERERLLRGKPASPEKYRALGFRYFVLDDTEDDVSLREAAEAWIAAGKARRGTEVDGLLVVDLARR